MNKVETCITFSDVILVKKSVTTAVDQTLTCTINGLTANGAAATVEWKDPNGKKVADDMDYEINNGRPDSSGTQSAELTIKAAKLDRDFASETSFTYTCSVKSGLYTNSPSSPQFEIVAEVLKLGNVMYY